MSSSERLAPAGAQRRLLIVALGCLSALGPLSLDLYLPALPQVSRDLGSSASGVQLTVSACLVGLALGQLYVGPLSDRVGRRKPMIVGLVLYCVFTALCAAAPSVGVLIAARLLAGAAGAAGIVVARAVVRDLYQGRAMARMFSLQLLISSVAPIVAPLVGAQILRIVDWRGVFVVMAGVGVAILVLALQFVPESLTSSRRRAGGMATLATGVRGVLTERLFLACSAVLALGGAGTFTYISVSSFVFQDEFHLSAEQFSLVFGINSFGVVAVGYLNSRLVRRFGLRTLLIWGTCLAAVGAVGCLVFATTGAGLTPILVTLFVAVATNSIINPNATAIGLLHHHQNAGTASAIIGTGPFLAGALLAPLAAVGGASAISMTVLMTVLLVAGCAITLVFVRGASLRPRELSNDALEPVTPPAM